jgi:hypothetical protein
MEQTNPRRRRASTRPAFADHINRLVIGNCAPSAPKRTEIQADADPAFDGPVIPFQDVIEILRRSMSAVLLQRVGSGAKFEFRPI